jgi:hypothetical protein
MLLAMPAGGLSAALPLFQLAVTSVFHALPAGAIGWATWLFLILAGGLLLASLLLCHSTT